MLCLVNATVVTPHRWLINHNLVLADGQIITLGEADQLPPPPDAELLDVDGLYVVPGFMELQINGAFGRDFTAEPDCLWEVAAGLPRFGVTTFLPTIVTSPLETISRAQAVLAAGPPDGYHGATPLGLHVEGPFLNPERKGAHNPRYLRLPNRQEIAELFPEQGVRLVTLAPELPGALELVEALVARGVVVSAGHSMATFDQAVAAFNAGIRYGTHIFNAMTPVHQFDPGLVGALLSESRVKIGLIPDGIHVHPVLVKMIWELVGPGRLTLVSDGMAALGAEPGIYHLGDIKTIQVDESSARLLDGTLAGSILPLDGCLRQLKEMTGCSLAEALATVTTTPAELLGMDDRFGRIAPGYAADLVLLTPELEVAATIVGGQVVYQRGQ